MVNQDTGYCGAHTPGGHDEMLRRASKGGQATRQAWKRPGVSVEELGALETVEDAQRWLRVLGAAVASGRLDKGDAGAAVKAIEVWLKSRDSLTEAEMTRMAEKIAQLQGRKKPGKIRVAP
jgi:hypothetical protein